MMKIVTPLIALALCMPALLAEDDVAKIKEAEEKMTAVLDANIKKLCEGKELDKKDLEESQKLWEVYANAVMAKNKTQDNTRMPKDDQYDFYLNAVKMSLVDFKVHGGWPVRSTIRLMVADRILKETKVEKEEELKKLDAHLLYCAIYAALDANDVDRAVKLHGALEAKEKYLAARAREVAGFYNRRGREMLQGLEEE